MSAQGYIDSPSLEGLDNISVTENVNQALVESKIEKEDSDFVSQLRKQVRSSWEFISACQFLVLFQDIFGIESFNTRVI
jgi:hypothetical protein